MIATFPHMGNVNIVMEDLLKRLGTEFINPPKTTSKTIALGASLSPELACFPLKVTLGNMAEALEQGADTVLMAGGLGPCRFGYYAQVQKEILTKAGYKFKMLVVEPPAAGLDKFTGPFKELSPQKNLWQIWKILLIVMKKARILDLLEKQANHLKCYEKNRGEIKKALNQGIEILKKATTKNEIEEAYLKAKELLSNVSLTQRNILKIGLIGEFYLLLDPFVNFDLEDYLGKRDVYTERSVYLTDWISPNKKNIVGGHPEKEVKKKAEGYLSHWVGGEGQATIGHASIFADKGFDGLIHIFPFTCMPEIIAQSILPKLCDDLDMPFLTLIFDEQTGRSGIVTRLEAFTDLLWARKGNEMHMMKEKIA